MLYQQHDKALFLIEGSEPKFMIRGNGNLRIYKLTPATLDDVKDMWPAQPVSRAS